MLHRFFSFRTLGVWSFFFGILSLPYLVRAAEPGAPSKAVTQFVSEFEAQLAEVLNDQKGAGTDQMALQLEALSQKMLARSNQLSPSAVGEVVSWQEVREFYRALSGGSALNFPVANHREAIAAANRRLRDAGIDFLHITQRDDAKLVEDMRDFASGGGISIAELKKQSDAVYPGLGPSEVRVPIEVAEFERLVKKIEARGVEKAKGFKFVRDERVLSAEGMPLTNFDAPLPQHASTYRRYSVTRTLISPPLALIGGAMGGGFKLPAIAGGATGLGLELQFIWLSSKWAKFWQKYGFMGNVGVNAAYCLLVTSAALAVEFAIKHSTSMNPKEFLVKSLFLGTAAFVGSFGFMQLASSRLKANGAFSEFTRFRLETWSVLFANFGRLLALGTAGLGLENGIGSLMGINFNTGDLIGWGIQVTYLLAVTLPMQIKLKWGEKVFDTQIRENFDRALGRATQEPVGTGGLCRSALAYITRKYSVRRL